MNNLLKRIIVGALLIEGFFIAYFALPTYCISLLLIVALLTILIKEWPLLFNIQTKKFWLIMPMYPILPFLLLIALNHSIMYREVLLLIFVLVPMHDIGSYFIGKTFGKHKLATTISPKKTWEGFFGGYLLTTISFGLFLSYVNVEQSWWAIAGFAFIVSSLAMIGDLLESFLKRRAHIKDSGISLPGHGGILDRMDAILFCSYFFYLFKEQIVSLIS